MSLQNDPQNHRIYVFIYLVELGFGSGKWYLQPLSHIDYNIHPTKLQDINAYSKTKQGGF